MMCTRDISFLLAQLSSRTFGESRFQWRKGGIWSITCSLRLGCRAVFYDEAVYPAPSTYDPDRFLKDGKLDRSVSDPEDRIFGSGRRYAQASTDPPVPPPRNRFLTPGIISTSVFF